MDKFNAIYPVPQIEWSMLLPIILVVGTGIVALTLEILQPKRNNNLIVGTSLAGLLVAAYFVVVQFGQEPAQTFGGMVLRDSFGLAIQLLLIGACFIAILLSEGYLREKRISFGEFYPLVLWSTSGAMIMASTTSLLMIFVGLEVLSIALYVLAGLARQESASEESAIKYFLLGAFASGFLLFGIAFYYGATGSLDLALMSRAIQEQGPQQGLLLFGLGLMLIGLGFKAAFVPFHQWTPDVYQGAPTNVTAFMAAGSKIAAIATLYRVLDAAQLMQQYWFPAMFWIAIVTMSVGNLIALVQRDVKRILAYSSIAHAGYILVGLLAHVKNPTEIGYQTTVYYLLGYTLMTVGAFAVVTLTARGGQEGTKLSDFHGLWRRSPFAAVALVIFMASLIGVPPTAGFVGKFMIFGDALSAGLAPLAIVLAVNSAVSVFYYLGIALAAFVADEEDGVEIARPGVGTLAATTICAAGVFAAVLFFTPLMRTLAPRDEVAVAAARAAPSVPPAGEGQASLPERSGL
jgi:NADH-quinone oxidoreductase subunit N